MSEPLRIIDLFCGTGGFSKGFENAGGFEVVYGTDLLPVAVETFSLNHPEAASVAGDIRTFEPDAASAVIRLGRGEVDVIIGGPPCQGFSSIRPNRRSYDDDPRNSLFMDFAVYVAFFRPAMFVMENVVGLATHKAGTTLEAIQETFHDLGYETDWRILNAAHFGVPQKRERLIMLGAERGTALSFPVPTHGGTAIGRTIGFRQRERMLQPGLAPTLMDGPIIEAEPVQDVVTTMDAIDDLPPIGSGESAIEYDAPPRNGYQGARRRNATDLTLHASTKHTDKMLEIIRHSGPNIASIPKHLISSGFSSCYSRLSADEPSVTITVNFVHPASNRCIHPTLNRALTPREGARIQSYDDDFRFAGSRAQIVRQIGNAVPPLLGQALGAHVAALLSAGKMAPAAA